MPNTVETIPFPDAVKENEINDQNDFRTVDVVSIGAAHAVHDTYDAFLSPLLPVLIENLSLTKTLAGSLTIFMQLPSLLQPVIGHIADRIDLRWVVIVAPVIAGITMSLIGIPSHYSLIAFLLIIAGLISAGLHSIGPVMAGNASGKRLGLGMSIWMVGGEVGRVLGPIVIVTVLGYFTLQHLPWLMIAGLFASILLYFRLHNVEGLVIQNNNGISIKDAVRQMKPILIPLTILVLLRKFMSGALTTFLPTFLTDEGSTLWFAGMALSVLEVAGVAGAFLAGPLSDKLGRRKIMFISLLVSPIFMFLFLITKGWVRFPILLLLGFFSISLTPVIMATVQENYPEIRSTANGIYMALGFVMQSISVIVIGLIGDNLGLRTAFYISGFLMLIGTPVVFFMPKSKSAKQNKLLFINQR